MQWLEGLAEQDNFAELFVPLDGHEVVAMFQRMTSGKRVKSWKNLLRLFGLANLCYGLSVEGGRVENDSQRTPNSLDRINV